MGYTDLLKQGAMGEVTDAQMGFLNVIRDNAGRMAKLISDLSDIYKAEGGRLHLETSPISLLVAVQNAAEQVDPVLEERSQKLEILVSEELPAVQGDPKRVAQMVQYLLENAALYSPKGASLAARARLENGNVRFMVVDSGIGVAPEDQALIFNQFFRSEVEEVREHKGWGLGLSVVKSLAELMDGQTGFETEPGKGSTFWFTLPLVK
jgi:signal transduction histidine kinase